MQVSKSVRILRLLLFTSVLITAGLFVLRKTNNFLPQLLISGNNRAVPFDEIDFTANVNYTPDTYCYHNTCNAYFFPTQEENVAYLMRHLKKKDVAKQYEDFLSGGFYKGPLKPGVVLFHAHSSDHHAEFQKMLDVVYEKLRDTYKLIVYDVGLNETQINNVKKCAICEYRKFPFDKFPEHVKNTKEYAFKPLIAHMMVQEYEYIVWMDASVRFRSSNLSDILHHAKENHVATNPSAYSHTCFTHREMFSYYHEDLCLFCDAKQLESNFYVMYSSNFTRNVITYAWAMCSLGNHCMNSPVAKCRGCKFQAAPHFCGCTRYDQAALTTVLHRLFSKTRTPPKVGKRGVGDFSTQQWIYPRMREVMEILRGDTKKGY